LALDVPPPRGSQFRSPPVLSRVHWVQPELLAEVKFLAWTEDNPLRQVVYQGWREDKPAAEVQRDVPRPKPVAACAKSLSDDQTTLSEHGRAACQA